MTRYGRPSIKAAARFANCICVQARLLHVPAETYASAPSVSAVLRDMITHVGGQLETARLNDQQRQQRDAWPSQLVAADFVADNDLQYTVMLQRIWLQVLGLHAAQCVPAQATAADTVVAETLSSHAVRGQIFDQLFDLEAGLLRLWMLWRPDAERAVPGARDV